MLAIVNEKFIDINENFIEPKHAFGKQHSLMFATEINVLGTQVKVWKFENKEKTIEPVFIVQNGETSWSKDEFFSCQLASPEIQSLILTGATCFEPSEHQELTAQNMSRLFNMAEVEMVVAIPKEWIDFWIFNNPEIKRLLDVVFPNGWHVSTCSLKDCAKSPIGWHRDYPYEFNSDPEITPLGIQINVVLDEATFENGATEYLVNSHLSIGFPQKHQLDQFCGRPGTMFVYHAATWHRSGQPFKHTSRNMILFNFVGIETQPKD